MLRHFLLVSGLLAIAFGQLSCNKEEKIPSYLHITGFTFNTSYITQGLNSEGFSEAWVFVNGEFAGAYETPVTIPLLTSGKAVISVFAGIKENGSSSNRRIYRMCAEFLDTITLRTAKVDTIRPNITYRSSATFDYLEDFEDQNSSFVKSGNSSTNDSLLIINASNPNTYKPGPNSQFSGAIRINRPDSLVLFEMKTIKQFTLPGGGNDVYLEMDVKTDIELQMGIYKDDGSFLEQVPVFVVSNTGGIWKKIYVNLKSELGNLSSGTKIQLFFGILKPKNVAECNTYLDNLKLVYLN